jgi:UDP-2,3-diacylglucosamine hydrolase
MSHPPPALSLPLPCVQGSPDWRRVDFISDVHLDEHEASTYEAWVHYMDHTPANALFILGDLFEVWVGDDNTDAFAAQCTAVLQRTAQRMPVYFMCGNRDFLVGPDLLQATGMHGLQDPCVLALGEQRFLLSHGDSLCLDDLDYMAFRAQVRQPTWQHAFLDKPLRERQAFARDLRTQSEARKHTHTDYADVDANAARSWLQAADCHTLIHGHTHRPAQHDLDQHLQRWVLSDWHASSTPARLEVLSWQQDQAQSPTHGLCRWPLKQALAK